ncbi:2-hydroxyhepta-2,4-diene-1,7-dioate isomerase [Amycolatopsis sp. WAC 04197]|uniref:fumarylacetoacetate hydrolase family protein n=1 Tax=Amycolatopsis sp. WAC 04197 TaxID=2203199 RepID=UPI000F7982C2|nr:fumarylacetoacetate hydrolase family protein [Amycolatopsis sp. WAC 04197]RSN40814.1 2-hydroxyhepta-2,4-diene-1,7-dioate isomerase [Amycolatopsis sp. WAC 04197]
MKLATILIDGTSRAARVEGETYTALAAADVRELLEDPSWRTKAQEPGERYTAAEIRLAPVVPAPGKVVCVGLNYRTHILEMGRDLPEYPTLFAKFADTLIGAHDDIVLPPESGSVDWEAELCVVIGATVRRATTEQAAAAIAGFTVLNDVSMRDWQFRTREWLQGKNFEASTPIGPVLVTPDELPGDVRPALTVTTVVDGEEMQRADTGDLVFDPVALVEYVSTMITLRPGDVIATGTPGGVGHARKPPRYLTAGSEVVTTIEHIGSLENTVRSES